MATDFFERQSDARRSTVWLVVMFCLAAVAIVGSIGAITAVSQNCQKWISVSPSPPSPAHPIAASTIASATANDALIRTQQRGKKSW